MVASTFFNKSQNLCPQFVWNIDAFLICSVNYFSLTRQILLLMCKSVARDCVGCASTPYKNQVPFPTGVIINQAYINHRLYIINWTCLLKNLLTKLFWKCHNEKETLKEQKLSLVKWEYVVNWPNNEKVNEHRNTAKNLLQQQVMKLSAVKYFCSSLFFIYR